jgi:hypothetical protein
VSFLKAFHGISQAPAKLGTGRDSTHIESQGTLERLQILDAIPDFY